MDIMKFITENALQMIAVCYVIGYIIKNTEYIKDKFIPVILIAVSLVLTPLVLGSYMNPQNYVQAILVVGAAILIDQVPKQLAKKE